MNLPALLLGFSNTEQLCYETHHVSGMMEVLAAGCCEFPKLNIIQKGIKHSCERKNHQNGEMLILLWKIPRLHPREWAGSAWLCVVTFLLLTLV